MSDSKPSTMSKVELPIVEQARAFIRTLNEDEEYVLHRLCQLNIHQRMCVLDEIKKCQSVSG